MSNEHDIDFTFSELEKSIMSLLKKKRDREILKQLCFAFHPIWNYYINFFLYKNGIYDNNSEKDNYYNEIYVRCITLLEKIDGTADYNRVKRYFNKSIGGWIFNLLFHKKKKAITYVNDINFLEFIISENAHGEKVDYKIDITTVEAHIKQQRGLFKELSLLVYDRYVDFKKFYASVYERYLRDGSLLTAEDFFRHRVGVMLEENYAATETV